MSDVLMIEPLGSGHRLNYVKWLARAFRAHGYAVRIATLRDTAEGPQLGDLRRELGPALEIFALPGNHQVGRRISLPSLVKKDFYYRRLFKRFYRADPATRPDLVFVPYVDYMAYAAALVGSPFGQTPWAGIILRPAFHLEKMGAIGPKSRLSTVKEMVFRRLLEQRTLKALFTIDETLFDYVQRFYPRLSSKLHYLPDPAELDGSATKEEARRALGLPDEPRLLLVYGSLALRKGIDSLIKASDQSDFPDSLSILLAGKQDRAVADLLKTPAARRLISRGRIHELNRFLTPDEEYLAFAASDMVWLGYKGHFGMSGVLVQAGRMGLPVLACREGLVGWLTDKHKLGITTSLSDEGEIALALNEIRKDVAGANIYGSQGKLTFADHTPENFSRGVLDVLIGDPTLSSIS